MSQVSIYRAFTRSYPVVNDPSGGGIEPPAGQIAGTALLPTVVGIQEAGNGDLLPIGTIADGSQFLKRVGGEIVGAYLGGDTLLVSVPAMLANTYADVSIATAEATGIGMVATAVINDPEGFPREADLSIPMVFSNVAGQIVFRFFGTVAAPVTQSVSFIRLYP